MNPEQEHPPAIEDEEAKKKKAEDKKKARAAEKEAKLAKLNAKKEKQAQLAQQAKPKSDSNAKKKDQAEPKLRLRKEYVNPTPPGEKKSLAHPMETAYDPPTVECAWYDWWEKRQFFKPETQVELQRKHGYNSENASKNYVIVIPPPNITGSLHLGHALTNSVQDALVRYHRMRGFRSLWVPGTDHAGIATQVTVEKRLAREQGVTRHDLGREAFVNEIWKWKAVYGNRIVTQLRRIGSSLDWTREVFTMDEKRCASVTEAFVRFYNDGLIYRATRLVNWDSALRTAVSDIEVDYVDLEGPKKMKVPGHGNKEYEFGVLVEFAYKVAEGNPDEEVVVATTRVETMLGDTAVAIHPEDPRYKHLHGRHVIHPFNGSRIPIVCDSTLVDMAFGTGVVKVTPAHDPNDYECGLRHKLPMPTIFTLDGKINELGGQFQGLMRFDAREAVLQALKDKDLYRGTKPNPMRLGFCSRSKDVIEPRLMPQWWVNCKEIGAKALAASESGELDIHPPSGKNIWRAWLSTILDWCISRQLWWGHRIPAYLVQQKGKAPVDSNVADNWVVARSKEEALEIASKKTGVPVDQLELEQDPDVLDTWFSSGLFPFSVFNWPEDTVEMREYYPGTILETGSDILFFWVAKMVMMGLQLTGRLPFTQVLLHAMVRDAHGRKMSKTLGNVIDPIDVIEGITLEGLHEQLLGGNLDPNEVAKAKQGQKEDFPNGITECGTDAMRFGLCAYTSQARDINLDIKRVEGYRNFCNKVWNATKFIFMKLGTDFVPASLPNVASQVPVPKAANVSDRWILHCLSRTIDQCEQGFAKFDFAQVTNSIFSFWRDDLCDVHLEAVKPILQENDVTFSADSKSAARETLYICLDMGLRLLHPFMPFLTEELYQRTPRRPNDTMPTISLAPYPTKETLNCLDDKIDQEMRFAQEIIRSARSLRNSYNVVPSKRPQLVINCTNEATAAIVTEFREIIKPLSLSAEVLVVINQSPQKGFAVGIVNDAAQVYLDIKDLIDIPAEIARLESRKAQLQENRDALFAKINNPQFSKAKPKVQEEFQEKLQAMDQELDSTRLAIENFKLL